MLITTRKHSDRLFEEQNADFSVNMNGAGVDTAWMVYKMNQHKHTLDIIRGSRFHQYSE